MFINIGGNMKRRCILMLIASLLVMTACDIKAPVAPQWDVNFQVPLMNKDYFASDLIDGKNFDVTEDSEMYFFTDGFINGADVKEDELKIPANEEGTGFIPIVTGSEYNVLLPIKDSDAENDVEIVTAAIREGTLQISFENTLTEYMPEITVEFAELKDSNGDLFKQKFYTNELNGLHEFSLEGYTIEQDGDNELLENLSIKITYETNQDPNPPDYIVLSSIKINYEQPIYFSQIKGLVHNLKIEAEDFYTEIDVDYPDNIENALHINSPKVNFKIWSKLGFNVFFDATLKSYNSRTGETRSFQLDRRTIERVYTEGDSTLTELVFQHSIETIMEIAPDKFELVDAVFTVNNPANEIGFAGVGVGFSGDYRAIVPFDISFNANEPVRPKELIEIEINDSNRKRIKENARGVSFSVKLKNDFTVGAFVNLYLCNSDDKQIVYGDVPPTNNTIKRIVFDDNYVFAGSQNSSYDGELHFTISEDDLKLFTENEKVYFGIQLSFEENDTIMHSYEKINVISRLDVKLAINGEKED
jgi:hypothetical protein